MIRAAAFVLGLSATPALAQDIWNACTFETLPDAVYHYPEDGPQAVRIGGRPAVPFTEGQDHGRLAIAKVDGYTFRFAPTTSVMDVEINGDAVASETGRCTTVNRPDRSTPLTFDAPSPTADPGAWSVREDTSSFDDSRSVFLSLASEDTVAGRYGGSRATPMLWIRCLENTTSLYIIAGGHFLSDVQGGGRVDYRIDDRPAGRWSMNASTDNEALGLWSGRSSIPAIKKLLDGNRLVVRLTPFNESSMEFAFPIGGFDVAISPLREACNW